jgi:C-terminal processing protease CtpA/Prc
MFKSAHEKFPDSKKPYYEVGNTAYIYQEQFYMCKEPSEYYNMEITEEDLAEDTIALIIYAHRQITRENSPIENVVIDLSCNGGGHVDTAVYMLCWFLGVAPMSITCPATGAQSTSLYQADINLDHKFDEKDTLAGKNLYCLTSELSFSCGNLVPCIFKASGKVTLIGRNTGGGSCVVMPMSTAWGTLYQTSGTKRISFVKNGSYYDVDRGVDPDVFLTKVSTFCDREKMTEIINNLY